MTTGRINQVAILGHTSGQSRPRVRDIRRSSAVWMRGHLRRHNCAGVNPRPEGEGERGIDRGGPRQGRTRRHGRNQPQCRRAGRRQGGPLCGGACPPTPREGRSRGHGKAGAAAQSPRPPENTTRQRPAVQHRAKPPHGSTPFDTYAPKPNKIMGGKGSWAPDNRRPARLPADAAPPPGTGPAAPRRFQRRPRRLACNIPGSGRGEGRRPSPKRRRRLVPSTSPSRENAPHRPGTKPVGSAVPRLTSRHTGSRPSVSIQAARSSRRGKMPAAFLDHTAARAGAHRRRRPGPGHGPPSLIAYRAPSATPERAEPRKTRKRPESSQARRRKVALALARGGDCIPTSQEGCGELVASPHPSLAPRSAPFPSQPSTTT
ncbi:hypothetical protein GOP47_0018372, partial [Adiantum capillus-veneris]